MAHISITDILPYNTYDLGEYKFEISLDYDTGLDATTIQVTCAQNGHETRTAYKRLNGQIDAVGWSVEANDTTADVYVTILKTNGMIYNAQQGDFVAHIAGDSEYSPHYFDRTFTLIGPSPSYSAGAITVDIGRSDGRTYTCPLVISEYEDGAWLHCEDVARPDFTRDLKNPTPITYGEKTYYYNPEYGLIMFDPMQYDSIQDAVLSILREVVTTVNEDVLIGRFEIDVHDAGGTGTESYWVDPGDWNSNPSKVLNLTINGALSGRHNDPLNENADYSYTPSDQNKVAGYGCGGDGGHGGGGGAGASTVVVYKFATNRANSKAIVAKPKRHGYGSGGGKGGKGGDGCILIYY